MTVPHHRDAESGGPGDSAALVRTACPMDCPDSCSLEVEVRGGAEIAAIRASDANPVTAGFICAKVGRFARRVDSPERILRPARRTGRKGEGRFEPISWDEALDTIARRFAEIRASRGGGAILPYMYGGSNGLFAQGTVDEAFWRTLGAARCLRTLCAAAATRVAAEMYGRMPGVAFEDFPESRLIILWGANPSTSSIHLVPRIREAVRRGARLVVVDPLRTPLADRADLHLPVLPGTDVLVALAVAAELDRMGCIDRAFLGAHARGAERFLDRARTVDAGMAAREAGVDAEDIRRLARLYAGTEPAVIRVGWGLERNRNGASAIAAILALPALAGRFGRRGGGFLLSNSGAFRMDPEALALVPMPSPPPRAVNQALLAEALAPGAADPVSALFVYDANPMASTPDQRGVERGLLREDLFTVVFDQVLTDTAAYADIVLPATTFLEQSEIHRSYGTFRLQTLRPAVPPRGEARPNHEVFAALARRLGMAGPAFDPDPAALGARVAASLPDSAAAARNLAATGAHVARFGDGDGRPVQFENVRAFTSDGRVDLWPEGLVEEIGPGFPRFAPAPGDARFPLVLLSPATGGTINSTMGEYGLAELRLSMCPEDAAARGLEEGVVVRVWNGLGEVVVPLVVDDRVRRGVAVLPKGAWRRASRNRWTATALVPAGVADAGGAAAFNDARVEVERA